MVFDNNRNYTISRVSKKEKNYDFNKNEDNANDEIVNQEENTEEYVFENSVGEEYEWYIKIPSIQLYAPIEEGTDEEILNRAVGHFEATSRKNGNCGLAAHNRGYAVNYFSKLKELKEGDIVNYFVDEKLYTYQITKISIIYETDWSMLEDTEEDKITLITCVENREEYRLCIQGDLINEDNFE